MDSLTTVAEAERIAREALARIQRTTQLRFDVPQFDPDTVKCESCGMQVFVLKVSGPGVPERTAWFEEPYSTGRFSQTMVKHTRDRCQALRTGRWPDA